MADHREVDCGTVRLAVVERDRERGAVERLATVTPRQRRRLIIDRTVRAARVGSIDRPSERDEQGDDHHEPSHRQQGNGVRSRIVRVGILHPGEMGAAVGDVLVAGGHAVSWASTGRSAATKARATQLADAGTVESLAHSCDVVLSVCPPHAAHAVAKEVLVAGNEFVFVDANTVSPSTAQAIGALVTEAGTRFVDGGIVGGPPTAAAPGRTRLYLSGPEAAMIADLFAGTPLDTRVLGGGPGAASALKACFAAYTKGTTALLLAIRTLADAEGVDDALLAEWAISQPNLVERSAWEMAVGSARKAWRFVGEMSEIADAFAAQGLPDGFHRASAELYAAPRVLRRPRRTADRRRARPRRSNE